MGNYAASGGYWISAKADYIFADPTTLTGSIGVFGTFPNLQGLLNNKIGLTFDVAKTNENADFGTVTQPLTEFQYGKLQEMVVKTYDDFTNRVAEGRGLRQTYVDSIGQGRVWSGADAIGIGLVDQLGDMEDAIAYAAQKANLGDDFKVSEWPKQKDFFTRIMESVNNSNDNKLDAAMRGRLGVYYDYLQGLENLQKNTGIQARMPFDMVIE
jgi:protease-4